MTSFSLTHWLKRRLFLVLVPAGLATALLMSCASVWLLSHHAASEAEQLSRDFTQQVAQHAANKRYEVITAVTDAYVSRPQVRSISLYLASNNPWLEPFYHRASLPGLREELDSTFHWDIPFLRQFFQFRLNLPLHVAPSDAQPTILGQANIRLYGQDHAHLASLAVAASFGLVSLFFGLVGLTLRPITLKLQTFYFHLYREASSRHLKETIPEEGTFPDLALLQTAIRETKVHKERLTHELQAARQEILHYQRVVRQQAQQHSGLSLGDQVIEALGHAGSSRLEYTTLSGALLITERLIEDPSTSPVQRDSLESLQKAITCLIRFSATPIAARYPVPSTSTSTCDVLELVNHLYPLLSSTGSSDRVRFSLGSPLAGLRQADMERLIHNIIGLSNIALAVSHSQSELCVHIHNATDHDGLRVTLQVSHTSLENPEQQLDTLVEVHTFREAMRRQRHEYTHDIREDGSLNLRVTFTTPTLAESSPLAERMADLIGTHRLSILQDDQGHAASLASLYGAMGVQAECLTLKEFQNRQAQPDILIIPQASQLATCPWPALRFRKYRIVSLESRPECCSLSEADKTTIDFSLPLYASPQYHLEQYDAILHSQSVRSIHGGALATLNTQSRMDRLMEQSAPEILGGTFSLVPASLGLLSTGLESLITAHGGSCQLYQRLQDIALMPPTSPHQRPILLVECTHDALAPEDVLFLHDLQQKGSVAILGLITQPDDSIPEYLNPMLDSVISFPADPGFITSTILGRSHL